MAASCETARYRIYNALSKPLQYRVEDIVTVLEQCSNKELQSVYPILLESLFGTNDTYGWNLRNVYNNQNPREFDLLFQFLHPNGPIFRACYKLIGDSYLKYDFPLSYLPGKVKKLIEKGMAPPFYVDKLQVDSQTGKPFSLALNPFELYVFNFAYFIINPWHQRSISGVGDMGPSSCQLILFLAEEYFSHFLPCDGSHVPVCNTDSNANAVRPSLPHQAAIRPVKSPTLLRQAVLLKSGPSSPLHASPAVPQQNNMEIWRSETIIQVFTDFWLDSREPDPPTFGISNLSQDFLPSAEHIRVIRNMIKHFHYFSNSSTGDMSAMDELKRVVIPNNQGKIYSFLRSTIHNWPLDSSFRLILETWLSYIQPWRYTDFLNKSANRFHAGENDEQERIVDRNRWLPFVAENLPSYTVIFQQLLPRFVRLDLSTPKNSQMLFRVTKVFSQINLNEMIAEVESYMESPQGPRNVSARVGTPTMPYTLLSPAESPNASQWGTPNAQHSTLFRHNHSLSPTNSPWMREKWGATLHQELLELEGPFFQYKSMFGPELRNEIIKFLGIIKMAKATAKQVQQNLEEERRNRPGGFLSSMKSLFLGIDVELEEYSMEERRKVIAYLDTSYQQLCSIFRVDPGPGVDFPDSRSAFQSSSKQPSPSEMPRTPDANLVLPNPRLRRKYCDAKYEGDPEMAPVMTIELGFLVRALRLVSSKINEKYGDEIKTLYQLDNFKGRLARQVLCPPMTVRAVTGKEEFNEEYISMPPRLSLRSLANQAVLMKMAIVIFVLSWIMGSGYFQGLIVFLLIWFLWLTVKAVLAPFLGCGVPPAPSSNSSDSPRDEAPES
ncbi:sphingomyelin phosphodiesterase 4 [Ischnura elegans]|uniref:sphingomyelin phosphodiesterase 4 n=1 Tax=Ischnura elegans TaxID=197161 RepID=UPI001ED883B8|nr:sphingomyelin phosphodiesterase 4 [Ischnura elegans]